MRKGSVLRILSAASMAGLLAAAFAPASAVAASPIMLTVTINGQPQQIALPSDMGPGLHDIQLPATISGQTVLLPPVEFVVSPQDVATLVTPQAPSAITVDAPAVDAGNTPTAIVATFSGGGGVTAEQVPLSDFSLINNSATFRPPGNLTPGNYTLEVAFTYPGGISASSPPQAFESTVVDNPTQVVAVQQSAASVPASGSVSETFRVMDNESIGVAGITVAFSVTGTLSASDLSTASAVTNADGDVTVTYKDPHAGDQGTIRATVAVNPSIIGATGTISVGSASTSGAAASVTQIVTNLGSGAAMTLGQPTTIAFVAETASGAGVSGVTIDLSLTGNLASAGHLSSPTAVTGAGGTATVTYTPDEMTNSGAPVDGTVYAALASNIAIHGETGNLTVSADAPAHVTAGTVSGQVSAGGEVAVSYTVTDSSGHVLAGVPVTATVEGGGLGASDASSQTLATNSNGVATFIYDAPDLVGTGTVVASAGSAVSADTTFTVVAGTPARVRIGAAPTAELVGQTYAVSVSLTDQYGNPIPGNVSEALEVFGTAMAPSPDGVRATYGANSIPNISYYGSTAVPGSTVENPVLLSFANGSSTLYFTPEDSTLGQFNATIGVALPGTGGAPPASVASAGGISISAANQVPSEVVSHVATSTLTAGVKTPITFTVLAADGNPIPGVAVEFQTAPTSSGVDTLGEGQFLPSLVETTNASGAATDFFIGVHTNDTGRIEGIVPSPVGTAVATGFTGVLTVVPGAPATISASFPPSRTDTLSPFTAQSVTFTVYDSEGNVVPNTPVDFGVEGLTGYVGLGALPNGFAPPPPFDPATSGTTNSSGAVTVSYAPNPATLSGAGFLWASSVDSPGVVADAGTMNYVAPPPLPADVLQYAAPVSGGGLHVSSSAYPSAPWGNAATVNSGSVSVGLPSSSVVSGDTMVTVNGEYTWNLTGELGKLYPSGVAQATGYIGVGLADTFYGTTTATVAPAFLAAAGSGGIWVEPSEGSYTNSAGTSATSLYVPVAQYESGAWTLSAPTAYDYWVVEYNSYLSTYATYQLDVSIP